MKLNKKIKNTFLILIFCLTSTTLLAGETNDAKSNLNKIQKQINLIDKEIKKVSDGILADIAPTILNLMNIDKPKLMTGKSLID